MPRFKVKSYADLKNSESSWRTLAFGFFFILLVFTGSLMNLEAMNLNGCKMPVLTEDNYEDEIHFTYQDKSAVNASYLTDIIPIRDWIIVSWGDILILAGLTCYLWLIGYLIATIFIGKYKKGNRGGKYGAHAHKKS